MPASIYPLFIVHGVHLVEKNEGRGTVSVYSKARLELLYRDSAGACLRRQVCLKPALNRTRRT